MFRQGRQAGWVTPFREGEGQDYATSTDQRSSGEGGFEGEQTEAVKMEVEVRVKRGGPKRRLLVRRANGGELARGSVTFVTPRHKPIPASNASVYAHTYFRRTRCSFPLEAW